MSKMPYQVDQDARLEALQSALEVYAVKFKILEDALHEIDDKSIDHVAVRIARDALAKFKAR